MVSLGFVGIFPHSPEASPVCLIPAVLSSLSRLSRIANKDSNFYKEFFLFITKYTSTKYI